MFSIELSDVSITRNNIHILKDISFKVPQNKTTVIVGHLGSGKSTLLKCIASIYIPDSGRILIDGKSYNLIPELKLKKFREQNGFIFQDGALWSNKSLYQNLELPLIFHNPEMSKEEISNIINKTVKIVGYGGDLNKRPSEISAGNKKLISFARALITDPQILFIDNPESSLDFKSVANVREIIKNLKDKNKTLVICTYDEYITSMMTDYLVIIYNKTIYTHGPYAEIVKSQDPVVTGILAHVMDKASNYDDDILNLITPDFN